jgi:S1-C subfamily serine protease
MNSAAGPADGGCEMLQVAENRYFRLFSVALLALLLAGASLAGPDDERAEVRKIIISEGGGPEMIFVGDVSSAFLGVSCEEETEHEEGGALVNHVVDDSPAAAAGMDEGDIIVEFDGETVRGPVGLTKLIHAREAGDAVKITVVRDGKRHKLEAELGDRMEAMPKSLAWTFLEDNDFDFEAQEKFLESQELFRENMERLKDRYIDLQHCEEGDCTVHLFESWVGKPKLGVQLVEMTPELREHLGGEGEIGVLVSKVLPGTPAKEAGIRVGDLIIAVDGQEVSESTDIRRALADNSGETFDVEVIRDGTPVSVEVTLPEPEEDVPTGPRACLGPIQ